MSKSGSPSSGKGLGGAKPAPTFAKAGAKITSGKAVPPAPPKQGAKPSGARAVPPAPPKPTGVPKSAPAFKAGQLPSKTKAMTPGAPVMGQARMAQPAKAAQQVNADRMKKTFGKLGF